MRSSYLTILTPAEGEITEKRSRFIGDLAPASCEQEALAFIEQIKKAHPDARHHCFAFICAPEGGGPEITRVSDDGEPSQTAGLPILHALQGAGLHDVCLVVTRYFGGTLLGTGGLSRAYAAAAEAAVEVARTVEKIPAFRSRLEIDYTHVGRLGSVMAAHAVRSLKEDWAERVTYRLLVPEDQAEAFAAAVTELTSGRSAVEGSDPVWFAVTDGEVLLFE